MASQLPGQNVFQSFLGVMQYAEQVQDWQMVGWVRRSIHTFDELDLDAVDGVIGFFRDQATVDRLRQAGVAAVNFSNATAEVDLPRVGHDEEAIGRLGAQHLLERGFARFAFAGDRRLWYAERRLTGFRETIENLPGRTHPVRVADVVSTDVDQKLKDWVTSLPKPIGVMAANDWRAVCVIHAALDVGLRVPEDVAVVGVDNDAWLTRLTRPRLTSIEPDWQRTGRVAAQMLHQLMRRETPTPQEWIKPLGLTARGSTEIVITEHPVVGKALGFIRQQCGELITVEDVLEQVDVSRRKLEYLFKRVIGATPHAAICRARVDRAKEMLRRTDASIADVARACGFGAANQLQIVFKRLTGMTPGDYRRTNARS